MNKLLILLVMQILCVSLQAEESRLMNGASPKLKELFVSNPKTLECLNKIFSDAFTNKIFSLNYYYTDDESEARAWHSYPGKSSVFIYARENQQAIDQFLVIAFEAVNSENEDSFKSLIEKAKSKSITKETFANEVLKLEFEALKKIRDLIKNVNFTDSQKSGSYCYSRFIGCPNDYDEFLNYLKKVSPNRDPIGEYEIKYDRINEYRDVPK